MLAQKENMKNQMQNYSGDHEGSSSEDDLGSMEVAANAEKGSDPSTGEVQIESAVKGSGQEEQVQIIAPAKGQIIAPKKHFIEHVFTVSRCRLDEALLVSHSSNIAFEAPITMMPGPVHPG